MCNPLSVALFQESTPEHVHLSSRLRGLNSRKAFLAGYLLLTSNTAGNCIGLWGIQIMITSNDSFSPPSFAASPSTTIANLRRDHRCT